MATDTDLLLFQQELETIRSLPEASRWTLERDDAVPLGLFAVMNPISHPDHLYRARFRWTSLHRAFSLKFIDMNSGSESNPAAWPRCAGFRPGSLDACIPITAEGQQLHSEWVGHPTTRFPETDAPLQFALLSIQTLMDNSYQGRGP